MTFINKTANSQHKDVEIIDTMRVFCNGFNLYGHLNLSEPLIEWFTPVFVDKPITDIFINHSFTVLQTKDNVKVFFENKEKNISNCGSIIKVCSNDEKIIILNDQGKLFKIELIDFNVVHELPDFLCSEVSKAKIVNISCGSKLYVAYSNQGNIFNIPNKLTFENVDIIDIKCGREHCLMLDKVGNVYTFGRGSRGQLGHGSLDDEPEPVKVDALGGIKVVQIAAGGWHSCALSQEGDLYIWGWNVNGQLGLKGPGKEDEDCVSVMALPHVVDFPDSQRNCVKVACGSRHTITLLVRHSVKSREFSIDTKST
ncbi:hypothetical protein NQ318_009502 [Aromia moschata]|uniref:RCC1 domain-containing protein 1 n=1 Tax=Aromia moschata TaxID=1265417 RepID=A0AAV8Z942_9CUCU|nr:hypothetical protein NQ318_009502 [Aromia moschata]